MTEKQWRRAAPGDDPVVEQFLEAQVDLLHHQLHAANCWHRSGRSYAMHPPVPRGRSQMMYEVDQVELREIPERRATLTPTLVCVVLANALFLGSLLAGLVRMMG